jgi:hypothetical protein
MALRSWIRRLENSATLGVDSFLLEDGTRYVYDFDEAGSALFVYMVNCMCAEAEDEPPEEPAILSAIKRARPPHAVLDRFRPSNPQRQFVDIALLLDETDEDPA